MIFRMQHILMHGVKRNSKLVSLRSIEFWGTMLLTYLHSFFASITILRAFFLIENYLVTLFFPKKTVFTFSQIDFYNLFGKSKSGLREMLNPTSYVMQVAALIVQVDMINIQKV